MAAPQPGVAQWYADAPCGLAVLAPDGTVVHANRTLERWLQYEPGTLRAPVGLAELLTMGGRIFHQTHLAPLLRMQGSVAEVKLELRRRDGRALPVLLNLQEQPAPDGQGVQVHVAVLVVEDRDRYERELLAQRKRAEELAAQHARDQEALAAAHREAQERARFAEQLVGVVSHDIRNPLSVIHLSLQLLRRMPLAPAQETVVERMSRSARRVQDLVGDLLDFTQLRLGHGISLKPVATDLHKVVADAVAELALAFPASTLCHTGEGPGGWVADPARIVQAVGNLVGNAVSHGAPGRPVTVRTAGAGERFRIAVHNEGLPIPPDVLPTLFQPMVRGPGKVAGDGGLGLGLYIVERIARAHGGEVRVASAEGEGTTFTIEIPSAALS